MRTHPLDRDQSIIAKELAITRLEIALRQDYVTEDFCESLADEVERLRPPLCALPPALL